MTILFCHQTWSYLAFFGTKKIIFQMLFCQKQMVWAYFTGDWQSNIFGSFDDLCKKYSKNSFLIENWGKNINDWAFICIPNSDFRATWQICRGRRLAINIILAVVSPSAWTQMGPTLWFWGHFSKWLVQFDGLLMSKVAIL